MYVCIYAFSFYFFIFMCVVYMYVHMLVCMHGTHVACVSVCVCPCMHICTHKCTCMGKPVVDDKIVLVVLYLTF